MTTSAMIITDVQNRTPRNLGPDDDLNQLHKAAESLVCVIFQHAMLDRFRHAQKKLG